MAYWAIILSLTFATICNAEESPAELYHRTVKKWTIERTWAPWIDYTEELIGRFKTSQNRLEIIGGFEEGILAIEKATVARGDGENLLRDATLSKLYAAYGESLLELNAVECFSLALDPHTLLIGAETVSQDDESSTYLCTENAENHLRNAATLDATNEEAEKILQTITGMDSVHKRKPKEFVAELFDSFADTFDQKLVDGLGYKVPQLVGEAAKILSLQHTHEYEYEYKYKYVLDAGCGTGLAGRFLKPLVDGVMIGVDASQKMLDIAAKCTTNTGCGLKELEQNAYNHDNGRTHLYDDLLVMDLEEMTLENTLNRGPNDTLPGFDLIVAADVFVYFGSLSNLILTFARISIQGAVLIFSCERSTDEEAPLGWRLLSSGRFGHTKQHAVEAASEAGYKLVSYEEIVPRMEKGDEVRGHLFGFVLDKKQQERVEL